MGYAANVAAGGNEAISGLLGMPVDAVTVPDMGRHRASRDMRWARPDGPTYCYNNPACAGMYEHGEPPDLGDSMDLGVN